MSSEPIGSTLTHKANIGGKSVYLFLSLSVPCPTHCSLVRVWCGVGAILGWEIVSFDVLADAFAKSFTKTGSPQGEKLE